LLFYTMVKKFGLGKEEKLKSRRQIDDLFARGKSFTIFPIRTTYRLVPALEPPFIQIGVTASKKNFKRAVDRNRIKRLLREAYRLQKNGLMEAMAGKGKKACIFFMYTDRAISSFDTIKTSMGQVIKKLEQKLPNENPA
jgi:ribonuclease P protein component